MSIEQHSYGPSFRACKLYRRKSAKGTTYLTGRLGGMRVSVVKSRESADNGETEIWSLLVSEAPVCYAVTEPKPKANQLGILPD